MKTLLVPTDFSPNAVHAMKYAIRLSQRLNTRIVFFHSTYVALSVDQYGASEKKVKSTEKKNVEEKEADLLALIKKLYSQLRIDIDESKTTVVVKPGTLIVEDIVAAAEKCKADMIVMGTHGASGIARLFGNNTSILIAKSFIPVLAVPPNYRYRALKQILYASDLKNPLNELKRLLPLAAAFGASIDVFNLSYTAGEDEARLFKKLTGETEYKALRFVQLKRDPGESVLHQLQEFLQYRKPDLTVMFHEKKGFFESIFGSSNTEKLSYSLITPLLAFRKK